MIHDNQVKKIVKKLGNKPLSDMELKKEATVMKLPKFLGVRLQDETMPTGNGCYIINTDTNDGQGIHWVSVVQHNKKCYVYDSFGRRSQTLLKSFVKNRIGSGYMVKNTDLTDQDQYGYKSVDCGHRCLSALKIYKDHGLQEYLKL